MAHRFVKEGFIVISEVRWAEFENRECKKYTIFTYFLSQIQNAPNFF